MFLNYNPWDVGTRRSGRPDSVELAALVADYSFDGVFLDTLKHGDPEIIQAFAATRWPVVLEGESRVPLAALFDGR